MSRLPSIRCSRRRQSGAVLVVGLVMLAIMTLLVISMLRTSVLELKIGGASQEAALNLANLELKMREFVELNQGKFAPAFTTAAALQPLPSVRRSKIAGDKIQAVEVFCGPYNRNGDNYVKTGLPSSEGGGYDAVYFDMTATATSELGASVTGHQGYRGIGASGMCPTK